MQTVVADMMPPAALFRAGNSAAPADGNAEDSSPTFLENLTLADQPADQILFGESGVLQVFPPPVAPVLTLNTFARTMGDGGTASVIDGGSTNTCLVGDSAGIAGLDPMAIVAQGWVDTKAGSDRVSDDADGFGSAIFASDLYARFVSAHDQSDPSPASVGRPLESIFPEAATSTSVVEASHPEVAMASAAPISTKTVTEKSLVGRPLTKADSVTPNSKDGNILTNLRVATPPVFQPLPRIIGPEVTGMAPQASTVVISGLSIELPTETQPSTDDQKTAEPLPSAEESALRLKWAASIVPGKAATIHLAQDSGPTIGAPKLPQDQVEPDTALHARTHPAMVTLPATPAVFADIEGAPDPAQTTLGSAPPPAVLQAIEPPQVVAAGAQGTVLDIGPMAPDATYLTRSYPHQSLPSLAQQARAALSQITRDQPGRIDLTLTPESLGRVHFDMRPEGTGLAVTLSAERPETLELMRRHLPDLLAELKDLGVQPGTLTFGSWSGGHPSPKPEGPPAADHDPQERTAPPQPLTPSKPMPTTAGGLDLRL